MAETQGLPTAGVDLGSLISSLSANPALLSQMTSMLSGIMGSTGDKAAEAQTQPKQEILPPSAPDLSGLLSAAPALVNLLGSMSHGKKEGEGAPVLPSSLSASLSAALFDGAGMKNRRCLLAALRPYLSPARCQSLDTVLGIMDVMTAFSQKK